MNHSIRSFLAWLCAGLAAGGAACGTAPVAARPTALEGQQIFRFDTFGNEVFWTDTLRMHEVIEGVELGGVGAGVNVDLDALPPTPAPFAIRRSTTRSLRESGGGWTVGRTATSSRD